MVSYLSQAPNKSCSNLALFNSVEIDSGQMSRSIDQQMSRYSTAHLPTEEHQQAISVKKRLEGLSNDEIKIKNRVNLLENEQKRILKKVEETRARATRIRQIKETSEQNYREKLSLKQRKEEEIREL